MFRRVTVIKYCSEDLCFSGSCTGPMRSTELHGRVAFKGAELIQKCSKELQLLNEIQRSASLKRREMTS